MLCKEHLKEFARIGNNVYKQLVDLSGQAPDFELPLYDQPDPLAKAKQSKRAANKKSLELLSSCSFPLGEGILTALTSSSFTYS